MSGTANTGATNTGTGAGTATTAVQPPKRYQVTVTREKKLWTVEVAGLHGGITDVEHFDDADIEVRDMIYLLTSEPEGSFEIDWHYVQGDRDYTKAVEELRRWESETTRASANRDRARQEIITTLRAAGLSQRSIAEVIGTSHQRVAQLIAGPREKASPPDE